MTQPDLGGIVEELMNIADRRKIPLIQFGAMLHGIGMGLGLRHGASIEDVRGATEDAVSIAEKVRAKRTTS